ncbi:PadR family transcriptional regulator [Sphingobium sp. DC-2]|uniref:PadR family transcriptional regulator n=1 Tax=Sphingobium sp. DC-2 TaxID=1303256 RepID=UPI0034DF99E6
MTASEGSDRPPAFGAVYTTLGRMVAKGLLEENSRPDSAGRNRRTFTISGAGRLALTGSMQRIHALGGFGLIGEAHA